MTTKYNDGKITPTVFVSGDWELVGEPYDRYENAYAAALLGHPWNGFAAPAFNREVATAFMDRQAALAKANPDIDWEHFVWDGDVIVRTSDSFPDEEPERIEPTDLDGEPVWWLDLGYTWGTVEEDFAVVHRHGE
jgi:hypothetical protein